MKDKLKTNRLLIAIGLVVLIAVILAVVMIKVRGGKQEESVVAPPTSSPTAQATAPAATQAVATTPPMPTPGAPVEGPGADKTAPGPHRDDPFAPLLGGGKAVKPPPPPPIIAVVGARPVLVGLLPPTILPYNDESDQRVAGVMWNGHVYAIVETNGKPAIVQPGDRIQGKVVRRINPQGLVLTSKGKSEKIALKGRPAPAPAAPVAVDSGGAAVAPAGGLSFGPSLGSASRRETKDER